MKIHAKRLISQQILMNPHSLTLAL